KEANTLIDEKWNQIAASLSKFFLSLSNGVSSIEQLHQLSRDMSGLFELVNESNNFESKITIPNALNSRIYCSGDIFVAGQGSVNSSLHAEGYLKINGRIRGGEAYGGRGIEINEAGSESGTSTLIAVPINQSI